MTILRFLARRLVYSLVVLVGVLIVVFALVHLVPGDPVRIALGARYTPEAYDALRHASGLDRPLAAQFVSYLGQAFVAQPQLRCQAGQPAQQPPGLLGGEDAGGPAELEQ